MKIAVIGGTGLMGPSLVHELIEQGDEVHCINRSGLNPKNSNAYKCNRNNEKKLSSILISIKPDLLIDMIPYTSEQAKSLSKIVKILDIPLIAISSIDVYKAYNILHRTITANYQECPIKENSELRKKLSFQGKDYDKLNVERIYLKGLENVTIYRMPAIYGLPDTSRIEHYVDYILNNSKPIPFNSGLLKWKFSRSLNTNCAYAISLGKTLIGKNIYNVSEESPHTEESWFLKIASILKWDFGIEVDETIETPYNIDTKQNWYVSSKKIRTELGYYEKYNPDIELMNTIKEYIEVKN